MQPKCVSDVQMQCLPVSISIDKQLHILSRPALGGSDAPRWPGVEEGETSPAPGTPKLPLEDKGGSNHILAYVSVLAAVVLGLLLYVAYKW